MKAGFTLVELSIVLVIIGLLIGGILVGQSLIEAAKLTSVIGKVQQYEIATNNFKTKFRDAIPGDTTIFPSPSAVNGAIVRNDKLVYSSCQFLIQTSRIGESFNFWYHLNLAGNLKETFKGYDAAFTGDFKGYAPNVKFGNLQDCYINAMNVTGLTTAGAACGAGEVAMGNAWILGGVDTANPQYTRCMSTVQGMALDSKLDDGSPVTGNVMSNSTYNGPRVGVDANSQCGNPKYNVNSANGCSIAIKADW